VAPKQLVIPISFLILASILLWVLIGVKGKWWLKLVFIIFVPPLGLLIWNALDSYLGWPTSEEPPERFILIWGVAIEPDPKTGFEGIVYIWGDPSILENTERGILNYEPEEQEPRAYKIPYSRELHEGLEGAKKKIAKGEQIIMERRKVGEDASGEKEKEGDKKKDKESGVEKREDYYKERYKYIFYNLPPAKLPPKNPPE
jgi:hypothetical protein